MTSSSKKELLKTIKERSYLNKDFDSLRADLLQYARTYFPDAIRDFSEAGLGGLLLEMCAYVGDVQSFYLDHQFQENFPDSSIETNNIQRHLKNAGVQITGASPAVVSVTFYIEVPADATSATGGPLRDALPKIQAGTSCKSNGGTEFELTEDLDFGAVDNAGNLLATVTISNRDSNNKPTSYILTLSGIALSGARRVDSFQVNGFEKFKKITLAQENITEIISVRDSKGNEYYEVESLTQDTVYKATINNSPDTQLVKENLIPIPAPYRFTKEGQLSTRFTTLTFGGGSAESLDDDMIPDPSEFAVPLYGKKVFSRFTINPGNLLQTSTLGILSPNTTLTIEYRFGGGLSHNIEANTIRSISRLVISFPRNPSSAVAQFVRSSLDVKNLAPASGGEDAPTIDDLKARVSSFRNSQSRIVTKEDLLARIYTMPSNFGRVFRASVQPNPNNPLATQLFIISRNIRKQLVVSPDSLKKNLAFYLNQYRMISDAIDILDAKIINYQVKFQVVIDPNMNKSLVMKNIMSKLTKFFDIKNYYIDQPIILAEVQNIIFNTRGVISIVSISLENISGQVGDSNPRSYSEFEFDIAANTLNGIVFPPPGGIFELRFKDFDLIGAAL